MPFCQAARMSSKRPSTSGLAYVRATRGEDPVRVIDCDCGHTLQAANDDDLVRVARQHVDQDHPDMDLSDDDLRALVADKAYTATDS